MSRRRPRLEDPSAALRAKRRRPGLPGEAPRPDGSPAAVEAALGAVAALFPRRLFGDALPPLVLRHQLYDVVRDRTAVDRHLNRLRDEGRVRLLHLGLGPDALGVVSLELYREKALAAVAGSPREPLVRRFLEAAVATSPGLSFEQRRMRELGFGDSDVTPPGRAVPGWPLRPAAAGAAGAARGPSAPRSRPGGPVPAARPAGGGAAAQVTRLVSRPPPAPWCNWPSRDL
ncbi:serine/threonine-protein kinase 19 isoform X3 [Vidua chalybeata]|uniref:serine/threonine-protein kinase 19 isoform X3 n=1 Tax=Vidua chalybeata TaxID=81927 RepID=UPI0023A8266F|nr:serine/threonine-protein kinase 19 isoform X3 [Vidua chalybeata]